MATYVARVARDGKTLLERADVTIELLEPGSWRGRFVLPPGIRLPRGAEIELAFADGRHGQAQVDHVHPALSKRGPRLAEILGKTPIA